MIYSMTAFARGQSQSDLGNLTCEIRSINHRYLEISMHLPDALRSLEMPMRDLIKQHIKRGKIECTLRYQPNLSAGGSSIKINTTLAQELCKASEKITSLMTTIAPASANDILRYPGVIEAQEIDVNSLQREVLSLLEKTLKDLIAARGREGEELKQLFLQRMDGIQQELTKVRQRLPQVIKELQERLFKRFSEAKIELDPSRLEQEMMIYAQRMDVAEELDRTDTHINEIRRILKQGGTHGRRMDFLMQELNREANTLGSKSMDAEITHAAVEMKVLIEQTREQVQNME